ncbi:MAG: hypothetical protein ACLR06_14580 [Christensenellaceae bacterium]
MNLLPKRTKIRQTGRVSASEPSRPAVTAPLSPLALPPALFLEMRRETVMGMPPSAQRDKDGEYGQSHLIEAQPFGADQTGQNDAI